MVVNHPIKTYKRNEENKTDKACLNDWLRYRNIAENTELYAFDDCNYKIVNCTYTAKNSVSLKADTAEFVIHRPFPSCVRVTVEKNSSFWCAACALFDSGYIVACFFRECPVNEFEIKTKLCKHNCKTYNDENNAQNRCKK